MEYCDEQRRKLMTLSLVTNLKNWMDSDPNNNFQNLCRNAPKKSEHLITNEKTQIN
jgi:hypothetical protein